MSKIMEKSGAEHNRPNALVNAVCVDSVDAFHKQLRHLQYANTVREPTMVCTWKYGLGKSQLFNPPQPLKFPSVY
jgi:hypothetical protein